MSTFARMKKFLAAIAFTGICSPWMQAQYLMLSTDTVILGVVYENQPDSVLVYVKNNSPSWTAFAVEYQKAFPFYGDTVVKLSYGSQVVYQGDSLPVWVVAQPEHNVVHKGSVLLKDAFGSEFIIPYKFQGRYSNTYYTATENKTEAALRSQLNTTLAAGYISLTYNTARDEMYADLDNVGGDVECVYTGRTATFNTRAGANSNNFNCEHTFPQGFFNENLPMKSDIHHLFPTDIAANSERGNLPFGVVSNPSWQVGGSKKNSTTFEPRDAHKGTAARAMMYFVLRYQDYSNFFAPQEAILRQWHNQFLPSAFEQTRNDGLYPLQNNPHQFVGYPQCAERITHLVCATNAPAQPALYVVDTVTLPFDSSLSAAWNYRMYIVNYGNTAVSLSNFQFSTGNLSFANTAGADTTLSPNQALEMLVAYYPGMNYTGETLTFTADLGSSTQQTIYFNRGPMPVFGVDELAKNLDLRITQQEINWQPQAAQGELFLYNLQGQLLQTTDIKSGRMQLVNLHSGAYVITASTANGQFSQKFVIVR